MADTQVAYKWVWAYNGRQKSAVVHVSPWCVYYTPGKTAYPIEGSGLFVFNTVENAIAFNSAADDMLQLWKVATVNARPVKYVAFGPQDFQMYWTNKGVDHGDLFPSYPGTMVCDSITLTRRIL